MNSLWKKFQIISKKLSNYIFLNLAYYLGIGIIAISIKLIGKQMLSISPVGSSWQKRNQIHSIDKMY
jgi:hypothetical protein